MAFVDGYYLSAVLALNPDYPAGRVRLLRRAMSRYNSNHNRHAQWQEHLHAAILKVGERTPRFLFRVWHKTSRGQTGLNTPNAITPLAFFKGTCPSTIRDVSAIDLGDSINSHYDGSRDGTFETYFSSWTQSFSMALLGCAMKVDRNLGASVHLSIIDTRKLSRGNCIFFTGATKLRDLDIRGDELEFMVFGVVSGDGHAAVPYQSLSSLLPPLEQLDDKVEAAALSDPEADLVKRNIMAARMIGAAFGPPFAMAVAAYSLSMHTCTAEVGERMKKELLATFVLPSDWAEDLAIMNPGHAYTGELRFVQRAFAFLGDLVRQKQTADQKKAKETARNDDDGNEADDDGEQ